MIILKQLNGKAIWLLDTLNQDSIEKKLARMYSTAYVNFVLCRQVYWIKVYMHSTWSINKLLVICTREVLNIVENKV